MSDIVYDGKQFDTDEELWQKVQDAKNEINRSKKNIIKEFYDNYNRRLLALIDAKGNNINY